MISGAATTVTNTLFGAALDFGAQRGVPELPWLLMTLVGLASAGGMALLDRRAVVPDTRRAVLHAAGSQP